VKPKPPNYRTITPEEIAAGAVPCWKCANSWVPPARRRAGCRAGDMRKSGGEELMSELEEMKARMAQALEAARGIDTTNMDFEDIIKIQTVCDLLTVED